MSTGDNLQKINVGLSVVLLFIFLFLLYANIMRDIKNGEILDKIVCHKEIDLPKIRGVDKLIVESIVEEYWKKKYINTSSCAKIWEDVKNGAIRGALGGAIMGKGWGGAATGAFVYGLISGVSKSYNLVYGEPVLLKANKHT